MPFLFVPRACWYAMISVMNERQEDKGEIHGSNAPALFLVHPVPQLGAKDVHDPVVQHHRVLGIEIE